MAQCSFPELDKETKPSSHWRSWNQGTFDTGALKKKSLKRLFNFDRKINYGCASTLTSRRLSVNDYSSGARTSQSALKPAGCAVEEASRWQTDRQTGRRTTEADWADFCIKRQRERESFFGEGTEIGTPTQSGSTTSWHLREPTAESWAEHDRSVNAFIFCQQPLNPQHLLVYIP